MDCLQGFHTLGNRKVIQLSVPLSSSPFICQTLTAASSNPWLLQTVSHRLLMADDALPLWTFRLLRKEREKENHFDLQSPAVSNLGRSL